MQYFYKGFSCVPADPWNAALSSASAIVALPRRPMWIVSAWWDLAYVVVTPLVIVPVVLILVRHWLTPEQITLAVIAFASLGHHLPGFMRAYGDRELFRRYRWRFLLAPPLVFAVALLFTPPGSVANALQLPWRHLHGLELILLFWGTWHGLMQTYGFMRIYDLRLGVNDRRSARLDHWLCLAVFAAGVVFSDARVFGIADAMWQSGLPLFGPRWLAGVRVLVGGIGLSVLAAYLVHLARRWQRDEPVSWLKLLLLGSTGWFYWYTGRLSTNVLIGLAMFEIYHAVQYDALVWIYNRRLLQRTGDRFGPLGFLFRDRRAMLGIYLAAIAAYSSIRYFTVDSAGLVYRAGSEETHQWLLALFVTSATLHFYFDGFIWKVSEQKTQLNLVEDASKTSIAEHLTPGLIHAGKWALLLAIAGGLLLAERATSHSWQRRETDRLRALTALTPNLPECQVLASREALARGNAQQAIQHAQQALALRPRSHSTHANLGTALMQAGRLDEARVQFEQAIAMAPNHWHYHCDLGLILAKLGQTQRAEQQLRQAVQLRPDVEESYQHLAEFYLQQERTSDAAREIKEIARRFPESFTAKIVQIMLLVQQGRHNEAVRLASYLVTGHANSWRAQLVLGMALNANGDSQAALGSLETAQRLHPNSAEIHYQLGLAQFQQGSLSQAIAHLQRAVRLNPQHFGAQLQLGNTFYVLRKLDLAERAYQRCRQLKPRHPDLCANLGALLTERGQLEEAERVYREGVQANPNSAALSYNLGVLLWQQGQHDEARELLHRAETLGVQLPPKVRQAISQ